MTSPVEQMFGRIAGVYDFLNHTLSLGIDRGWRRELAQLACASPLLGTGAWFPLLDLAAGTLDVAMALERQAPESRIIAMDFCPSMLQRGLRKLDSAGLRGKILPTCADALCLPLPDASVAVVTMAFGIRNIPRRADAIREMLRVLAPGGRICILEFGSASERIWGGTYNVYLGHVLPAIGRAVARDKQAYNYLAKTIREFPAAASLAEEMRKAGLNNVQFRKLTGGIVCLHWGDKRA